MFVCRQLFLCVCVGFWAGLIIGFVTEYYTSNAYMYSILHLSLVQDVVDSSKNRAATNVIFGLTLEYKLVIVLIFAIAINIFFSFSFATMYGIVVVVLEMLSTIATGLTIDAYGRHQCNVGGIAEMACMSRRIHERTNAHDAAGNTTAIGKGFATGLAALVSLALFGGFVTYSTSSIKTMDVSTPKVFMGLNVGAMLLY
ncbi:putative inorganic diphosphatase [Helianthus annuus]|nr:putative inorganic diphosphatase [Helianthus annuus]